MSARLPDRADVVVIGGGVVGSSVAYHLGLLGAGDVVLLERKKLTCGTTWHSAAQVRQLRSSRSMTEIIRYSVQLYSSLEAETGQATGWTRSGSLSIADNPDRLEHIRRQAGVARCYDIDVHEVGPDEIKTLWPLLDTSDILGGIYCPADGRANPSDLCAALIKGAKSRGVRVVEDCPVTGFDIADGRVRGVRTPTGTIACEAVALCAGLWSRDVAALAGLEVPVHACEHFYLLTKPIDGIEGHLPTLGDHDNHLYIRDEVGGLLVGCFEPEGKPIGTDALPKDFEFDLLDEDWDHFEPMMMNAMARIPALEQAEARMLLNGPESFTPDGHPIVGEAAELDGFYLACGLNSAGVACGGGVGKALAEWIIEGAPTMDLLEVDACRFHASENALPGLGDRVGEVLGLHYAIAYPGLEHATARDLRTTPLYDRLAAAGARFGQRFGAERALYLGPEGEADGALTFGRPPWFDAVAAECAAARNAVALFDESLFGKVLLEGADVEAVLQRVCSNDMSRPAGRVVYTAMLNDRGGIESDLTALRLNETSYLLYTNATALHRDMAWIRRHVARGEDVAFTNMTDDLAVLGVVGPRSRDLLAGLCDADLSDAAFPYFSHRKIDVAGRTVRAARLSYAGELGWELSIEASEAPALCDALMEAGEGADIRFAGAYAMNALRIEKQYLSLGHDMGPDTTPPEAGLDFIVKSEGAADYVGRAAIARQREAGLAQRLVTLLLDETDVFPFADEPILRDGQIVGQVTSAAFGHTLGRPVALGYVGLEAGETAEALEGQVFAIEVGGRRCQARATLGAAFDAGGLRLRGRYEPEAA